MSGMTTRAVLACGACRVHWYEVADRDDTGLPGQRRGLWVRAHYCAEAVETPAQEAFVLGLEGS